MIEFNCPACGNPFRVQPDVAGRHGWCKICHGFILVPTLNTDGSSKPVTIEDREHRLELLLREAATRYERLTIKIALIARKYRESREKAAKADAIQTELTETKTRYAEVESILGRQTADLRDAVLALRRASSELDRLSLAARTSSETESGQSGTQPRTPYHSDVSKVGPEAAPVVTASESRLHEELAQIATELSRVTNGRAESASALRDIETQLGAAQRQYESLFANLDEKSRALGAAEASAKTARHDLERINGELQTARSAQLALEERLIVLEREAAQAAALERERISLCNRLEQSDAQLQKLREELTSVALHSENASSRAAQAALDLDRLHTDAQEARAARATAELALRDALVRAERAEAQLPPLSAEIQELRLRAGQAQNLEDQLRSANLRMTELESLLARLTPDLSAASQALGAYESRAEQTARDLERLKAELDSERQAKLHAEAALQSPAMNNSARKHAFADPDVITREADSLTGFTDENLDLDNGELTLVPEILDDTDAEQSEMVNVLLRFLEPEERER
ncbi:MAG: hypothetical protein HZB26_19820 [Candidatus Hydrogenedentes bacterium]|nr:hypothetical protein [Candidatus Hydrogenedentota bacterium]